MQRLHANYANINININTNYNIIFNYNTMAAAALRAASGHREKTAFYLLWNMLRFTVMAFPGNGHPPLAV